MQAGGLLNRYLIETLAEVRARDLRTTVQTDDKTASGSSTQVLTLEHVQVMTNIIFI